jgi:hypothetical protein
LIGTAPTGHFGEAEILAAYRRRVIAMIFEYWFDPADKAVCHYVAVTATKAWDR